jgi:hypothetical protein
MDSRRFPFHFLQETATLVSMAKSSNAITFRTVSKTFLSRILSRGKHVYLGSPAFD